MTRKRLIEQPLSHFGTDGIRGRYGSSAPNYGIAFRAGVAAAAVSRERLGQGSPRLVVGRDARRSGAALLAAVSAGFRSLGGAVFDLGVAPTPCVAYATRVFAADVGCSLTASHNPAADNGIKFFDSSGVKPSEEIERALDEAVEAAAKDLAGSQEAEAEASAVLCGRYEAAIADYFPARFLEGARVALDCANGALHEMAPRLYQELGAEVSLLGVSPDGQNINDGVGSECPAALRSILPGGGFDFAFAFDGDGDRVVAFDGSGEKLPGEALLAAFALDAKSRNALPADTLVTTVQSNLGLDAALRSAGIAVVRTSVGDKHIARMMREKGFSLGGEESGHLIVGDFAVTGDGLLASLALCEIALRKAARIEELATCYRPFPQASAALRVQEKRPLEDCPAISACRLDLERRLGEEGRLLIRYSGTEPKLRLLVEAGSEGLARACLQELLEAARRDLAQA